MPKTTDSIQRFFQEMTALWPTNPELVFSRQFLELWEESCQPKPVAAKGPYPNVGGHKLPIPKPGKYVSFLEWDPVHQGPVLVSENCAFRYRLAIQVADGEIGFAALPDSDTGREKDTPGQIMEVIYDVIEVFLARNPDADIFRIKKKEFAAALDALDETYDPARLRRISRFSAAEVRKWIQRAARDMALEDLKSQISLPLGDTFAFRNEDSDGEPEPVSESEDASPDAVVLPERTPWTIQQEMAVLVDLARLRDRITRECRIPLVGAEVVPTDVQDQTVIRLKDADGLNLNEGLRFAVHAGENADRLGECVVALADDSAVFLEIYWENPGERPDFDTLHLRPLGAPAPKLLAKIRALFDQVRTTPDEIAGALRPVLGLPVESATARTSTPEREDLDLSQRQALAAAVDDSRPVVAVQGPPGTGKTKVLAEVIRALCAQGQRLIVTAPSNTAVDNICRAVWDLPVLRFGAAEKVEEGVRSRCWAGDGDQVERFIQKSRGGRNGAVYAATHVRAILDSVIARDFQERGPFDAVLFDEAGMSRMDEFLLCAQLGKQAILFGDQRQLPPFPLSGKVRSELAAAHPHLPRSIQALLDKGALEWLIRHRNAPRILLERSYRCQNPRLLRFSSTLFYHARVRTSETAEYFRLPFHARREAYPRSTLRFYCTSALPEETRQETLVFSDGRVGMENRCEVTLCRFAVLSALDRYPPEEITVISPYKRQIQRLRSALRWDRVAEFLPGNVTPDGWRAFLRDRIATVDSFQGGESDLVIISYVRSNPDGGIGFVDNPNRINVAHTRCRKELVIIGDLECLKRQAKNDIFIRMERSFRRDGEILDVDAELLGEISAGFGE
jgi:hypothetical protein